MLIAVFGAGGVGGYFGGRLAQSGQDVVFVARGEHLKAMRTRGLKIDTFEGRSDEFPVKATDDPSEIGPVDAVILAVKAGQVADAASVMSPLIGPHTFIVPFQNGVEAPIILSKQLGAEHVFGGLCYIVAFIVGPGHIKHAAMKPVVAFGELDDRVTDRGKRLLSAFESAGITTEIPENIQAAMWRKFVFIASISGVGAVARAPMGVVRSVPETRALLEAAMKEVASLAADRGIRLADDAVASTMAVVDSLPAEATASMQRDIMEGRPSELDFQSGSVVRLAAETGTPTPVHSMFYASLLPMEMKARGRIGF